MTIVDQTGRALSAAGKDGLQAVPQQLEWRGQIARRYETTITDLLVPVFGRGNFRVSADADIDFSQSKESLVKYGQQPCAEPGRDGPCRTPATAAIPAAGIPGALSNSRPVNPTTQAPQPQPPQNQQNGQNQQTAQQPAAVAESAPPSSRQPQDHQLRHRPHDAVSCSGRRGICASISLAVLVNNASGKPLPAERMSAVKTLVASAIGAGQNPHITVVDLPFETVGEHISVPGAPWWTEPWVAGVEQNGLLALAGMLALFGGVLPLLRRVTSPPVRVAAAGVGGRAGGVTGVAGVGGAPGAAGASGRVQGTGARPVDLSEPAAKILAAAQDVFSIEAETVQTLVNNDPARTAQVIKGWIAGDRNSLKQAS